MYRVHCTLLCSTFTYPGTGKLNAKHSKCESENEVFLCCCCCCCRLFLSLCCSLNCNASYILLLRFGRLRYGWGVFYRTLMRLCLKLKIVWFHENINTFYIFQMQIWTDIHSVCSFDSELGKRHFISVSSVRILFIFNSSGSSCPRSSADFHAQNMPPTNWVESRRSHWFYAYLLCKRFTQCKWSVFE